MTTTVQHTVRQTDAPPGRGRRFLRAALGRDGAYVAIILASIPLIYLFGFRHMRFFMVPSRSMEPTLLKMDYLLTLNEPSYQRGDVVVMEDPEEPGAYVVKRIIGMGGDVVSVSGGGVFINDAYVSEPYILGPPEYTLPPTPVPEGSVFVLGDNRNNSDDSHLWPNKTQPAESIIGRVRYLYYPYDRAGELPRFPIP